MVKHIKSLREFVDELDAVGEIQQIDAEVDWNLEIGAIIRRSYDLRAPAPLFANITGYQIHGIPRARGSRITERAEPSVRATRPGRRAPRRRERSADRAGPR